ncbi:MAG: VCBS repeat-containing protein [candidate division Zixibacteria bacterium]|nr:VCBS repeat-containing protein [candidate division Zixibacteria bacterium]MDH3937499.1 VCBS repeat-containing protein [candidate division Zixibacteria bacterium]MDH4035463.1 VCBS repeat-containing protein [candidate division Zixibacteria bacterium]
MVKHMFVVTAVGLVLCGGSAHALYPIFDAPVQYFGGAGMTEVVAVDLDGDGDRDLATADFTSNYFTVLLNDGDGAFAYRQHYYLGFLISGSTDICAADLDDDGDIDLAISRMYDPSTVAVLINHGDATFETPVHYDVDNGARGIFAADLDGDLDKDIVTTSFTFNTVSVLKNNGDGTFQTAVDFSAGPGEVDGAEDVVAGDLDGDLDLDLAVANSTTGDVYVLLNNGDASFSAPLAYAALGDPRDMRIADLDADGDRDLAMSIAASDEVSLLLNNGDGTFAAAVLYPVGDSPQALFVGDLNRDGYNDLMTANFHATDVSILWNNEDGTFSTADTYETGTMSPNAITAGDLDGDGNLDLVVGHYLVLTDGRLTVHLNLLPPSQPCGCCTVAPGDLDGDGTASISDLIYLVDYMFFSGPPPICQ